MASKSLSVDACVPTHVTEHTEAAPTAFESADKGYENRGSNSEKLYGSGITHASLPYDYSSGSSGHVQDTRRLDDAVICIP